MNKKDLKKCLVKAQGQACKAAKKALSVAKKFNPCSIKFGQCVDIKISRHGIKIIYFVIAVCFISLICTGLGFLTTTLLFFLMLTIWFFRDPERVLPDKKNVVVSPCDGLILKIETASLPEELNSDDSSEYTKISTFMNVTDMHVQRIPVDGTIKQIEYIKGTFINASLDKASKDNERNLVLMEAKNCDTICIVQIAGFVARRIVCDVKKDEVCKVGERYGMIKFGSRIELYIPKRYKVEVLAGQRLVCGETVVASWK
ncbi:MAG: phosphatidylserine decarboxylase family protein [Rickettsiales bacterium]|nr:phosphatidylserine decarboxylase family protein [Rickettsiales bacterium]